MCSRTWGGRPRKAAEGKKGRYVSKAARETHCMCQPVAAYLSVPGNSKAKAFAREVARAGSSLQTVKHIWKSRQSWADRVAGQPPRLERQFES